MVGRQGERPQPVELALPVVDLLLEPLAGQPLALPDGEVGVLDRQFREVGLGGPGGEGGVVLPQLAHQDAERPAVGDDVMGDEDQVVPGLLESNQGGPHQRPGLEIERLGRQLARHPQGLRLLPHRRVVA